MLNTIIAKLSRYRRRKYFSELIKRGLTIGKNTCILDGVFLDPSHCFLIYIGDNCTLAPNVRILAHDASMKIHVGGTKLGKIRIYDNCFIGDSTIILPGVSVGPNTIIGCGSIVTRDIPPDSVAVGNPAKVIMTIQEFIKKHAEGMNKYRCFPREIYDIRFITDDDKKDMISYLTETHGYMK